ncbi:MAG TPA: ribonuclease Z [Candidatus Nanoarchaeia archaeon]|nr:ribonuclease Z [Candidatus Nanoarchaeia archaeon]
MINLTFLGTSDAIPTAKRNHTSMLLTYQRENILFDCGEGTQRQFRKVGISLNKITKILISHWHGDHVLGIPGILQSLSLRNYNKTLYIYGPKGTKTFMGNLLKTFVFHKNYEIKVQEVSGKFLENKDFYLEAKPMQHGIPCNAYSFVKKGNIRIDRNKLKKAKLPNLPLLKNLKHGKDIIFKGKKYLAKNLTFKEKDTKISFIIDTKFNDKIISFAKDSDVIVCEATFSKELEETAKEYMHLTSEQAAQIAKKSNSKKLVLIHISQRYEKNLNQILEEAKKIFKNSMLAEDLKQVKVE